MKRRFLLILGLFVFLSLSAKAGDLYLIKIDSQAALDASIKIAGSARGMIGNRFLAELSTTQIDQFTNLGLSLEKIVSGYSGQELFLISSISPKYVAEPKRANLLYSQGNSHLASLSEKEIMMLRDEGFGVIPIGTQSTPFFYHDATIPAPSFDSYPSDMLADLISLDSLYSYVHRLELFQTRYAYSDSLPAARDWLEAKFREFGYSAVYFDDFTYNGRSFQNVVCFKPGIINPKEYIVIGAHYDSYCGNADPMITAPGADDNASGTAAVLELARILKDVPFNNSIMFVTFSVEEMGLIGSAHMASELKAQSTDIEFMLNYDMVGFTMGDADSVVLYNYPNYYRVNSFRDAARRLTDVTPMPVNVANGGSDEYSFYQQGYRTVGFMEWDFNTYNYHHTTDISANMDFPYFEKILKISAAGLAVINNALPPVAISVYDIGDGHALRVNLQNYNSAYSYRLYYGQNSSISTWRYTDSVNIPSGQCQFDLTGLIENTTYYMAAMAIDSSGYHSIDMIENSLAPRTIPRAPYIVSCIPDTVSSITTWKSNIELDINHYRILRSDPLNNWAILADNSPDTVYRDLAVEPHVHYSYKVQAVDNDLNVSDSSNLNGATPATFDWPLLFLEETNTGGINPSDNAQRLYYDSILTGVTYDKLAIDSSIDAPVRCDLGQYSSVFYIDDDNLKHWLSASMTPIEWYLGYETDMLLAGWMTIYSITGNSYFYPGNIFYDHFGLSRIMLNSGGNFVGANPLNGWPALELKNEPPFNGKLADISIFEKAPNAQVIYTYKSEPPGSYYDNKPVGIAFNTGYGQRVVLGFPIYYLTVPSAQALLAKVQEYFAKPPINGDANHDDIINALDITFLINYLYKHGTAPLILNNADPNADCRINILDITYLINFLYKSGPAPKAGCAD